jgi:hypothetical protein
MPASFVRLMGLLFLLSAAFLSKPTTSAPTAQAQEGGVRLRCVKIPLKQVVQELAAQSGQRLLVAEELRECKAVVLITNRPAAEVRERLAQVFGAHWVPVADAAGTLRLERLPSVQKWLTAREEARKRAEKTARAADAAFLRKQIADVLSHRNDPAWKPEDGDTYDAQATQFLASLPPGTLDQMANWMAAIPPCWEGGIQPDNDLPFAVFTPDQLNREQQSLIETMAGRTARKPGDEGSQRLAQLPQTRIFLTSSDGGSLEIEMDTPGKTEGRPLFTAFSGGYSATGMISLTKKELAKSLARLSFPPEAMLGAAFVPEETYTPAVTINNPNLAEQRIKFPAESPLRWQMLEMLASETGLNVIADHCTRSDRLPATTPTLAAILQASAEKFRTVFRQEGTYLLARRMDWADDDRHEIPAPLPENLITRRENGQPFTLEDAASLVAFSGEALDCLSLYNDGHASLERICRQVQYPLVHRRLLLFYRELTPDERAQCRSAKGLRLDRLSVKKQRLILACLKRRDSVSELLLHSEATLPRKAPNFLQGDPGSVVFLVRKSGEAAKGDVIARFTGFQ